MIAIHTTAALADLVRAMAERNGATTLSATLKLQENLTALYPKVEAETVVCHA